MCVCPTQTKFHVDMFQPDGPLFSEAVWIRSVVAVPTVGNVLVHRITWCGMHQQERMITNGYMLCHRHPSQPREVFVSEHIKVQRAHGGCDSSERSPRCQGNSLGDGVIVIAPNPPGRMLLNPFDTGHGIRCIVDNVAEKDALIEGFINGRQGGPVCVNVSQQQNLHQNPLVPGQSQKVGLGRKRSEVPKCRAPFRCPLSVRSAERSCT